ncbi:uncharacterized protein LOC100177114 [Ciona intestinalis]
MSNFSNDGEKLAFLNGLKQYLEDRGKVLIPYPRLAGKVLDLHDLYNRVTSLGGYNKVTERELWDDFLAEYNFPSCSSSLSYGLRAVYQRFLEEYEKVHHFGEDEGNKKTRFNNSIRRTRNPTFISDQDRQIHGLSSTRITARYGSPCDYERLVSSLISCLPNEIDFAINACTLLSGESRHVLRLPRCPQVLDALLLHAGIVSNCEGSYACIAKELEKNGQSLIKFWVDTVDNMEVLDEMLPTYRERLKLNEEPAVDGSDNKECSLTKKQIIKPTTKWPLLFQSKRSLGIEEREGQRILQISLVLLNLSFEEVNLVLLAKSRELVRFVFLCIHSEYSALKQTGLDILGNVSSRMNLNELGYSIAQCTYKTLIQCTSSADKFDRIRGFEILGNLCSCEANKENLIIAVTDAVISAAILCLPLSDIELIVAALEALYKLSKLGEETCTRIMLIPHSIDLIVNLITINIRAFGSEQLSKIRIARRVVQPPPQPVQRPPNLHNAYRVPTNYTPMVRPMPPSVLQRHIIPTPQPRPSTPTPHPTKPPTATPRPSKPIDAGPMYTHTDKHAVPPVYHYMPAPPPDIVLDKSPESFAQLWTWATYEACPNTEGSTPRVQLFAEYAAAASRYGMNTQSQVLPAAEFGRCLQRVFPHTASRLFNDDQGQPLYHITGIQKRQTPLPVPGHHPQVNYDHGVSHHMTPITNTHSREAAVSRVMVPQTHPIHPTIVLSKQNVNSAAYSSKNKTHATPTNTPACPASTSVRINSQLPQEPVVNTQTDKSHTNGVDDTKPATNSHGEVPKSQPMLVNKQSNSTDLQNGHNGSSPTKETSETATLNHHTDVKVKKSDIIAGSADLKPTKAPTETTHKEENSPTQATMCNGIDTEDHTHNESSAINGIPDTQTQDIKLEAKKEMVNGILDTEEIHKAEKDTKPIPSIHNTSNKPMLESTTSPTENQKDVPSSNTKSEATYETKQTTESNSSVVESKSTISAGIPKTYAGVTIATTNIHISNTPGQGAGVKRPSPQTTQDEPNTKAARILPPTTVTMHLHKPAGTSQPTIAPIPHQIQPKVPQDTQRPYHPPPHHILPSQITRTPLPPQPPHQQQQSLSARHRKQGIDLMAANASLLVLFRNVGKQPIEDYTDEKEDPISKSVRLTAVLILINISNFCCEGRSILQLYEPRFSHLAMSGMDCSPMLAKLLADLDR